MKQYTMQDIRTAYQQKKVWEKQFPVSYFIFRPLSFFITYLTLKITESPSRIAFVGFAIGILGNLSFVLYPRNLLPGIVLLMLCALSDAVDGNTARTTGQVTYYGKYLDSVLGVIVEGSFPFWMGIGLYLYKSPLPITHMFAEGTIRFLMLVCGAAIMAGIIYTNKIGDSYDYQRIQKEKDVHDFSDSITAPIGTSLYHSNIWYLIFVNLHAFNLQLIVLLACYFLKAVDLFIFAFTIYYAVRFLVIVTFYTFRARKRLYS